MPSVPLEFSASPLPANFKGTPQQFLDAIVSRLSAESPTPFSFFVSGDTAPTSNVGPWLKDGVTWYVWNDVSGSYVPETLEDSQRQFIAGSSNPNPAIFTFWIDVQAGVPQSIKYYYGGSWQDIYKTKFAEYTPTSGIQALISAQINQYPFRAVKASAAQAIVGNAGPSVVVFDSQSWDPSNVYAANQFTAPVTGYYSLSSSVKLVNTGGTPTGIVAYLSIRVQSSNVARSQSQQSDETGAQSIQVHDRVFMNAGEVADVTIEVEDTGDGDYEVLNVTSQTVFSGNRILT